MRLMGTIIAVLLAIIMAVFPISMPQAAVSAGHQHGAMHSGHGHGDRAAKVSCDNRTLVAGETGNQNSHDAGGQICCSMGSCHALQAGTVPTLHLPAPTVIPAATTGDEQVDDIIPGRLDRPPRAV